MDTVDILIIGAGATGLMAARTLAKNSKRVVVLEALDRIGGRIHTIYNENPAINHIELGAEFVHGDLPVSLGLLNEAGIKYCPVSASMWQYDDGKFSNEGSFIEHWDLLVDKLNELTEDINLRDFLQKEFPDDQYQKLRASVIRYVSGYDTAAPERASCFALRNEWQNEDEGAQHRVESGYCSLINYLADECKAHGGIIHLNTIVKDIFWECGKVKVTTPDGTSYQSEKVIVAIPLGVLQAGAGEQGAITFHPPIKEHTEAIQQMGFGAIIKVLLLFDEAFWDDQQTEALAGKSLKDMGFLLSAEAIPTWWTQHPQNSPLLTGWLGGPNAETKKHLSDEEILEQSLQSLSRIFKRSTEQLKAKLKSWHVANWTAKPFTRGSYAYDTVATPKARKILDEPVNNTVYFAGEYLYEGAAMGTVEAALTNGLKAGEELS